MFDIIVAGYGEPLLQVVQCLKIEFNILGVILDFKRKTNEAMEFNDKISDLSLKFIELNELHALQVDAIFVVNYNKIIPEKFILASNFINLHIGLLPKYRGNNANAWAILNNEKEVGYTIHKIINELDAGDIFYQFKYHIKEGETYYHAKYSINMDICNNLSSALMGICNKTVKGISQKGCEFIYGCKLKPEDGIIISWNISTDEIFNKFIIFSRPLGTGLKLSFNNKLYEISKLSRVKGFSVSVGIMGAVVMVTTEGSIWIKTKTDAISIDEIYYEDNKIAPSSLFKIGDRL